MIRRQADQDRAAQLAAHAKERIFALFFIPYEGLCTREDDTGELQAAHLGGGGLRRRDRGVVGACFEWKEGGHQDGQEQLAHAAGVSIGCATCKCR